MLLVSQQNSVQYFCNITPSGSWIFLILREKKKNKKREGERGKVQGEIHRVLKTKQKKGGWKEGGGRERWREMGKKGNHVPSAAFFKFHIVSVISPTLNCASIATWSLSEPDEHTPHGNCPLLRMKQGKCQFSFALAFCAMSMNSGSESNWSTRWRTSASASASEAEEDDGELVWGLTSGFVHFWPASRRRSRDLAAKILSKVDKDCSSPKDVEQSASWKESSSKKKLLDSSLLKSSLAPLQGKSPPPPPLRSPQRRASDGLMSLVLAVEGKDRAISSGSWAELNNVDASEPKGVVNNWLVGNDGPARFKVPSVLLEKSVLSSWINHVESKESESNIAANATVESSITIVLMNRGREYMIEKTPQAVQSKQKPCVEGK